MGPENASKRQPKNDLSLAKNRFKLKLLTFWHGPANASSMMKILLKLLFKILLGPEKDSDLALENLALRQQVAAMKRSNKPETVLTLA